MLIFKQYKKTFYDFVGRLSSCRILLLLIRFYQVAISPHLGHWCRFEPSCSEYARQAVTAYGVLNGMSLAVFRLCRCHPFCKGGVDPVPECGVRSVECGLKLKGKTSSIEPRTWSIRKDFHG